MDQLIAGEYGTTCRLQQADTLHEIKDKLNELSSTLEGRSAAPTIELGSADDTIEPAA